MHLPPEDKDPPTYDSMYPGKPPKETFGYMPSSEAEFGRVFRTLSNPELAKEIELSVTRGDNKKREEKLCTKERPAKRDVEKTTSINSSIIKQEKEEYAATPGAREVLEDFCTKTTAHGFNHIVKSGQSLLMRIFWLFVTMIGVLMLLSSAYDVTHSAFVTRRPTIEIVYHDLYSTGMRVPYMTICSLAGFWKSKLERHNVSTRLASYLLLAVKGTGIVSPSLETDTATKTVLKADLDDYLKEHNLTLGEMVTLLSPEAQCCQELLHPTLTGLGQCFTSLSPGDPRTLRQTFAGILGGLKVIFAVNISEQIAYEPSIASSPSLAESGIHISLSSYDLSPAVATSMQALRVAPNTAASVALSLSMLDKRERYRGIWPWSVPSCITEEDFWQLAEVERSRIHHNLFFHTFYRTCPTLFSNCTLLALRFQNDSIAECLPSDILEHKAEDKEMMQCLEDRLHHDRSEKKLCEVMEITQQMSHTTLMPEMLEAHNGITIMPNLTYSMVDIYYTQLGFTEHRESVPNLFTWFSNLGGQMGLFLGASMITLVEFYFTMWRFLCVLLASVFVSFSRLAQRFSARLHRHHA